MMALARSRKLGKSLSYSVERHLGYGVRGSREERNLMHMKSSIALFAGVVLLLSLAMLANAEDQKRTSTKQDRLSGTVHMIDKDASSIIIRKGKVRRQVVYDAETKFTIQNKRDGSIDDVIVGMQATCLGRLNDKTQLVATRVDVRAK